MRKTTKFLTLVLAVIMTVSMFATGASAAFEDVDYTTAEGDAVNLLVSLGVTKGTTETKFGTAEDVTRQQMAAFIYRLMKAGKSVEGGVNTTTFTDLTDATFYYMISWANQTGVIKGVSDTKFNPTGNIILQDAFTMVVRALGYEADGPLSYPFGYIEKAEEIGLDEDLPSTLGYTDVLTRGNVATILANAFYADMATYEIAYESLGYTLVGNDGKSYDDGATLPEMIDKDGDGEKETEFEIVSAFSKGQKPYNKYDTVASKVFGVEKVVQYVVATPTFSYGDNELEESDVEMIKFNPEKGGKLGFDPDNEDLSTDYAVETVEFAELGLEGKADDYFLAGIELYIKKDGSDKEILGATSLLTKKTVNGADIEINTVSGTSKNKYYTYDEIDPDGKYYLYDAEDEDISADDPSDYKRMSGLLTIDGVKTYVFDAPYSYAKPEKIADINADNAEFLSLGEYDGEWEDEDEPVEVKFNYNVAWGFDESYEEEIVRDSDGDIISQANVGLGMFELAYHGGLYEMDVYDIDNDGRYEFISYKPYVVAKIDDAEGESVKGNGFTADGVLMIDRTIVAGVEAEDKDVVIAVVNADANYADIKAVLEPTETRVTTVATKYAKFASGEKHEYAFADLAVANADSALADPDEFVIDSTDGEYYFYEGKLVKSDAIANSVNFNEDWVIVLDAETTETAVMNGNKIEKSQYVSIYHDGEIKDVKAKKITEAMMEKARWYEDYTQNYWPVDEDGAYLTQQEIEDGTEVAGYVYDYSDYVGKLATAKTDSDGAYYFDVFDMEDEELNDVANLEEEDEDTGDLIYAYTVEDVTFIKKTGYNYAISDNGEAGFTQLTVKDYTQIIIEAVDEDGDKVFEVYGYDNLPDFDDDMVFAEATVIVANNYNSETRENLVVLYAKTDVEIETSRGKAMDYRVVLTWIEEQDEDEETVYTVTTFDPATGEKEDLEATGDDPDNLDTGAILVKTSAGYLSDEVSYGHIYDVAGDIDLDVDVNGDKIDSDDKVDSLGYVVIDNYDEDSKILEVEGYTDYTFTITDETVFLEYDNSEASVKEASEDCLSSTAKKWNRNQKSEDEGGFKAAFISAVEDEDAEDDGYYLVDYVVIVHA